MKKTVIICFMSFVFTLSHAQIYNIDILVVLPSEVLSTESGVSNKINTSFLEVNNILKDSKVNLKFNNVGIVPQDLSRKQAEEVSGVFINCKNIEDFESTFPFNYWYKGSSDGYKIRNIVNLRKQYRADVVVYIDYRNTGVSSANLVGGRDGAYVKIAWNNFGTLILAHEVGHVLGLTHEMGAIMPFDKKTKGFRSIMAVNCAHSIDNLGVKDELNLFSGKQSQKDGISLYEECNQDCVTILNRRAYEYSQWGEEMATHGLATPKRVPNKIKEITVVNDCRSWAIDSDKRLWIWDMYQWVLVDTERRFKYLNAKDEEMVFLVDTENVFITYNSYTKVFGKLVTPEKIEKLATNYQGKIYILTISGKIYEWQNLDWILKTGNRNEFIDLSLDGDNNIYAIGNWGYLFKWENNNWVGQSPVKCKKVSAGKDGTVVILGEDQKIYVNQNGNFLPIKREIPSSCNCQENNTKLCDSEINNGKANTISVYNKSRMWAVASDMVYKYIGNNGFLQVYEYGEKFKEKF